MTETMDYIRSMESACLVIKALSAQNIVVRSVTLANKRAVIRISYCRYCDQLIQQGKAIYQYFGCNAEGRYRQGQFNTGGCKVVWTEALQ